MTLFPRPGPIPPLQDLLHACDRTRLSDILAAADALRELDEAAPDGRLDPMALLKADAGEFETWRHYPARSSPDPDRHRSYYFHLHPVAELPVGHFHTFLHHRAMPANLSPRLDLQTVVAPWPGGRAAFAHLAGLGLDADGSVSHLFLTNRWVTGEAYFEADAVLAMLDVSDRLSDPEPGRCVPEDETDRLGYWLDLHVRLYRPQIEWLHRRRCNVLAERIDEQGGAALEDRAAEIMAELTVNRMEQARICRKMLGAQPLQHASRAADRTPD